MRNVVSVFSCGKDVDPFYDVTVIAAKIAKAYPEKKILMVHRGNTIVPGRPYMLSFDKFKSIKFEIKGLWNLYAFYVKENSKLAFISPDQSEYFLKKVSEQFDLVICDAGSEITNPFTLGALFASGNVFYLLDGLKSSLNRYAGLAPILSKLAVPTTGYIFDFDSHVLRYSSDFLFKTLGEGCEFKLYFIYSKNDDELDLLAGHIGNRLLGDPPRIVEYRGRGNR